MSVPPLGRTSPTRTPATGSSSPSARGKTNQEGEVKDVRFVKGGVASPAPEDRVVRLSPQMGGAAGLQRRPGGGVEAWVTAPLGPSGLASELTSRGASTTDVMLAGNWRTSGMVAHYSARPTAERGAVAQYLLKPGWRPKASRKAITQGESGVRPRLGRIPRGIGRRGQPRLYSPHEDPRWIEAGAEGGSAPVRRHLARRAGGSRTRRSPATSPSSTSRGEANAATAMRRSEVSALRWAAVATAAAGDGMLVTVRRGKTSPEGEMKDVRFVKDDCRPRAPDATGRGEPGAR